MYDTIDSTQLIDNTRQRDAQAAEVVFSASYQNPSGGVRAAMESFEKRLMGQFIEAEATGSRVIA